MSQFSVIFAIKSRWWYCSHSNFTILHFILLLLFIAFKIYIIYINDIELIRIALNI